MYNQRLPYRGQNRGLNRGGSWHQATPVHQFPAPALGESLVDISHDELEAAALENQKHVCISEQKYIASYNWANETNPTIMIPGEPPRWTPLIRPRRLKQDVEKYYCDKNAARYPEYPLEAMVRAVLATQQEFNGQDIDIVACNGTLSQILRFARGESKPCRILVENIGSTVFFLRRENSPFQQISDLWGYGHTFPEAYTTWSQGVSKSISAHRVIKYDLAGLQCMVRVDTDGYLPDVGDEKSSTKRDAISDIGSLGSQSGAISETNSLSSESIIVAGLVDTKLSVPEEVTIRASSKITLDSAGRVIPQTALFDLKTRSIKKAADDIIGKEIPRLWISQIPNLIVAYHEKGIFYDENIIMSDVRADVDDWEKEKQPIIKMFAALLKMIIAVVQSSKSGRLEINIDEGSRILELREQCDDAGKVLPIQLEQIWLGDELQPAEMLRGDAGEEADEEEGLGSGES